MTKDTKHEEKPKHKDTPIELRRVNADRDGHWQDAPDGKGFALFSDGKYAIAIDPAFKLNEKVGVIVEAFQIKGGSSKTTEELAQEVFAAIANEGADNADIG